MTRQWVQADPASLAVPCTRCNATPLQRCMTAWGGPTATHAVRKAAGQAHALAEDRRG